MIRLFTTLLLILVGIILSAQSVAPSELEKIEGDWNGTLTYTDYKDDVSQSTLKCKMKSSWKDRNGMLTFLFVEPDGRIIKDKTKIKLNKNGTEFVFDGKYKVLDFSSTETDNSWKLTIGANGKDNNRNADLKCVIDLSTFHFTISKWVKYQGTENYFERNRYTFERDK